MKPETVALRQRVYDLMGGCCVDCGEGDYDKLTIDHVHHDGAEDRRTQQRFGASKYQALLRHGIPQRGPYAKELRCWNCNQAKKLRFEQFEHVGGASRMPPAANKKQLTQTVSKDTYEYLEKIAEQRECSLPKAIEQVVQEHKVSISSILDLHTKVDQILATSRESLGLLPSELRINDLPIVHTESLPVIDPYEALKHAPPPEPPAMRVIKRQPSRWSRFVWKLFGASS